METPAVTLTPEQEVILRACADTNQNLMIMAYAGCGKTFMLKAIEKAQTTKPVLFLAFNKKIATDAETVMGSSTIIRTFNGLGQRTWSAAIGKRCAVNPRKTADALRDYINGQPRSAQKELWDDYWNIVEAVGRAKTLGHIPAAHGNSSKSMCTLPDVLGGLDEPPTSSGGLSAINHLLLRSIQDSYSGTIDFNDQIYMPVLFTGSFPRFPLILVDEYQDLNPLNHAMIRKLVRPTSSAPARLIGVGDPNQNIYGFRGAAQRGMEDATEHYNMRTLPLSVSFRCPETIVRGVHWHVPEMQWDRAGGQRVVLAKPSLSDIADDSAILCRNNAPLFALAMHLLSAKRSVSVAGSDVGPKIVGQMKKFGPATMSRAEVVAAIQSWLAGKLDAGSTTAEDTAGCMNVFAAHGATLGEALLYADHLFKQTGNITLSTVHKAKGLEWPTVYHLDPFLMRPGDENLRYVCETRSSDRYFELCSGRIQ